MFKSMVIASSSRSPSERVIRRYPVGANVTVYVNPNIPSDSVLEPMDSEVPYYLGVAGFFSGRANPSNGSNPRPA